MSDRKGTMDYACPRCGAGPGVPCFNTNNGYTHQKRRDVARMLDIIQPGGHTAWPVGKSPK